jgi:cellulose synthase/poly-beta-1,6-N-acetylglucosamine synthase-like glycosyltransferase
MDWLFWILAIVIALPMFALASFVALSLLALRQRPAPISAARQSTCAILVPAHNEEAGISATLANLQAQLQPHDRVIVIADNCSDSTAKFVQTINTQDPRVSVLERQHETQRGKGFALDYGLNYLREHNPPDAVVIVDADGFLETGCLDAIVNQALAKDRPAQAVYLMNRRSEPSPKDEISAFAILIKNLVRPLGLYQVGMPCLLTGSGMAFPWRQFAAAEHGTGNIVEDMKLGVDLALSGHPPQLVPHARITSAAAPTDVALTKQRTRWEHGHVQTLLSQGPRLIAGGLKKARLSLIFMAIELIIPPVSLLLVIWAVATVICALWWQLSGGALGPVALLLGVFGLNLVVVPLAWWRFGRGLVSGKTLLRAPFYVLWKIPIYLKLVSKPEKAWVRTDRTAA